MSSNVIELDNTDQYLIYQQLEKQPFPNRKSQQCKKQPEKCVPSKERKQISSKIVLRPTIIKLIDRILSLYLQQKTPYQIQLILKQPTLPQIQFILKQKIQTFLNIIFESSNCYTEEQIQKRKSQIDKKIQRISTELLDPLAKNFLDPTKFINFLKLMKYHREGRRSQKISKQSNSFFKLFFLKMKFEDIPHTQGNVIELNESVSKMKNKFESKNDADSEDSQYGGGYSSSKSLKNSKNSSFKTSSVSKGKKYSYPKQLIVNEKMMDEVTQQILTQIRSKTTVPDKYNENPAQKLSNKNSQNTQTRNCIDIEKNQQEDIEWTFDKQISLIHQLFQSYNKNQGISKTIRHIYKLFFMKYPKISESQLNFQRIYSKVQSMYSVSCQKFVRRVKFLTIKEGLEIYTQKKSMEKDKGLSNQLTSMQKNRRLYSIMEIEKHIEEQTDKKYLTKQEQFYFTKLKERLKVLDAKPVYFSAFLGAKCIKEWKFMLDMIKEFYFSTLEDMRFEYLLKMVEKLNQITINDKDRNLSYLQIPVQDEQKSSQSSQKKDTNKQTQKYLDQMLPKFSLSSTLRRIGKSNQNSNHQKTTITEKNKNEIQKKNQEKYKTSENTGLDEVINKSIQKRCLENVQNSALKNMNSNLTNSRMPQNGFSTQNKQSRQSKSNKNERGERFQESKVYSQQGMMKEEKVVIKIEQEPKVQTVNIQKNEKAKKSQATFQQLSSANFLDKKIMPCDFPKPSKRRFDETNLENSIIQTSKQNTAKRIKPNQKLPFQENKYIQKVDSETNKNEIQTQIVDLDDDQNEDQFDQVLQLSDQLITQNDRRISREISASVDKKSKQSQQSKYNSFQHNEEYQQVKAAQNVPKAKRTVQKLTPSRRPLQQNKLLKSQHKIQPQFQEQEKNLYIDEEESPDRENHTLQMTEADQNQEDDLQQIKLKKAMQDIMEEVQQQVQSQQKSQRTKKRFNQQQDFDMSLIQSQDAQQDVSIQKGKQNSKHNPHRLQIEDEYSIYEMEQYLEKIGREMFNNDLQDDCSDSKIKKKDSVSGSKDQQNNENLYQMGELDQKQEWQIIQRELLKIKSMEDSILNEQQAQIDETQRIKKQSSKIKRTGATKTSKQLELLLRDSIKFPHSRNKG